MHLSTVHASRYNCLAWLSVIPIANGQREVRDCDGRPHGTHAPQIEGKINFALLSACKCERGTKGNDEQSKLVRIELPGAPYYTLEFARVFRIRAGMKEGRGRGWREGGERPTEGHRVHIFNLHSND